MSTTRHLRDPIYQSLSPAHQTLLDAKASSQLTFAEIATSIGRSEVWVAAVFYGQAKPEAEDLEKLEECLGISGLSEELGDGYFPQRGGLFAMPPTDALLYRLYEIVLIFGQPLKAIIHEKFGDGIMSAIDFRADVEKIKENGADRVKITLNGKWLPYSKY